MEPDGDTERLFIAPTGEDSEGQRGGKKKCKRKQRGAERRSSESNMSQPAASMLAVCFYGRESIR